MRVKKEFRVGLDIGTRFIKVLELSVEGDTRRLTKLRSVEINTPLNKENTFKALKSLLEEVRPSTKELRISLSAPSAIVRFINMPKMKEGDLKSSLRFEAEKYIPFNIKEVIIDAAILDRPTEDKMQMRVLFAAAKRDSVDLRVAELKELGFSVSIIDIDSFACFNAFSYSSGAINESVNTALLNIGYTQTNLIILRGAQPFFTRDIQIGAKDVSAMISKKMHISTEESDKLLLEPGQRGAEVYEASKPVLNNLIDELRLSFGYYENQHGTSINEIYLSGGGSGLSNMLKYFEENFETKTALWDPLAKFEFDRNIKPLGQAQSQYAVSAGLVIRK